MTWLYQNTPVETLPESCVGFVYLITNNLTGRKYIGKKLYYCASKSECSYIEAREQFSRQVLESTDYYNGHIQVRVHGRQILNKL